VKAKVFYLCILVCFCLAFGGQDSAYAQVDPSTSLLLKVNESDFEEEELDSSLYTRKPRKTIIEQKKPRVQKKPSRLSKKENLKAAEIKKKKSHDNELFADEKIKKNLRQQVKELILGAPEEKIAKYRGLLHPRDFRKNLIEVGVAPVYIYNNSSSRYWFRDYYTSGPGLNAHAQIWVTPFFGIKGNYMTSMSTNLRATTSGNEFKIADHQWYDVGFRFRKFYSFSRKARMLSFGIDYSEYQLRIPKDSSQRVGLRYVGPKVSIEAFWPSSHTFAWIFGSSLYPKLNHSEVKTALSLKSGAGP